MKRFHSLKSKIITALGIILSVIGLFLFLGDISFIFDIDYATQVPRDMFKPFLTPKDIVEMKGSYFRHFLISIFIDVVLFILGIVIIERKRFKKILFRK